MSDEKIQNLWGQAFRLVSDGLAEGDVVTFVEKMMSQHRKSLNQADHISTLHKLASLTVEEAQELASNIRATAKREAESEASRVLADAQSRAKEILESAEYTVKSQTRAASRLRKAAAAMEALRQAQLARFDEIDAEATDAQGVGPPGALYTDEVSLSRQAPGAERTVRGRIRGVHQGSANGAVRDELVRDGAGRPS